MKHRFVALAVALAPCTAAYAQEIELSPSADFRLRYEHAGQDGLPRESDAVTLRLRSGIEAKASEWSALIEGEATVALAAGYNDGLNGKAAYPIVADPGNIELNRAQIRYSGAGGLTATAGRQRIEIADQRFVGSAAFRQNEQTFDAARLQWTRGSFSGDLTYAWSQRTIHGTRGHGARQPATGGDNLFAVAGYSTGIGTFTAFAYLVDQDEAEVQGYRLSSQTYGVRLSGNTAISPGVKLGYTASWARQSDYHNNPSDYAASYLLGEATLVAGRFNAAFGYEVLGADAGAVLTSFQTPLASFFRFNGWAGKFGTTPPDGLRDTYGTAGHRWAQAGPFDAIDLAATWHSFGSDRRGLHYGNELDLVLSARMGRAAASIRYARYRAGGFATDTDKLWLTAEWAM